MDLQIDTIWYRPHLDLEDYPERVMAVSDATTNLLLQGRYREKSLTFCAHLERLRGATLGEEKLSVHLREVRALGSGRCLFAFDRPEPRCLRVELLGSLQVQLDPYGL